MNLSRMLMKENLSGISFNNFIYITQLSKKIDYFLVCVLHYILNWVHTYNDVPEYSSKEDCYSTRMCRVHNPGNPTEIKCRTTFGFI